uniref:Uncharacterized protein n=1 Tax=Pediastrum duplex TaxID=3105 RepID=A0A2U8GI64_PEDDU|nr:hypothetical protein [Pediastrum duplex]
MIVIYSAMRLQFFLLISSFFSFSHLRLFASSAFWFCGFSRVEPKNQKACTSFCGSDPLKPKKEKTNPQCNCYFSLSLGESGANAFAFLHYLLCISSALQPCSFAKTNRKRSERTKKLQKEQEAKKVKK